MTAPSQPYDINVELTRMKTALADAITKWAGLEDGMASLLVQILNTRPNYAPAIYFAPSATETRFEIVDAVTSICLQADPKLWQFKDHWKTIRLRLDKAKRVRNKIAHGAVMERSKRGVGTVRLTGPSFQAYTKLNWNETHSEQLPGLSAHDVEAAGARFSHCAHAVGMIEVAIAWTRFDPGAVDTLHRTALALATHLSFAEAQTPDRAPADTPDQPEPSPV